MAVTTEVAAASAARERRGTHAPLLIVLALAALLRLAMMVAYPGGFVSSEDAFTYLAMSWSDDGFGSVGIVVDRPSGYGWWIELASVLGHSATWLVVLQHVGGLLVGVLAYALMLRLGSARWLATLVAAVLLLDSYALTLEHWLLTEAATTLLLTASCVLLAASRRPWLLALSGVLLGAAITMRTASLFLVPVWLVYVLWKRRAWRLAVPALLGLALLPVAYMSWHAAEGRGFGMSELSGWFLYARVGEIGECGDADIPAAARAMCPALENPPQGARVHLWGGNLSPAWQVFGNPTQPDGVKADPILGDYARAIIRDRPLVYTRMVGRDVLRYFDPTDDSETGILDLATLPAPVPPTHVATSERLLPGFEPSKRAPAGLLGGYAHVIHLPRPLLGVLSLVAALLLAVALVGGRRFARARRAEALLLLGGGLSLLVGATATSDFVLRYMMPGIPILLCGIALVLEDAATLRRRARAPADG